MYSRREPSVKRFEDRIRKDRQRERERAKRLKGLVKVVSTEKAAKERLQARDRKRRQRAREKVLDQERQKQQAAGTVPPAPAVSHDDEVVARELDQLLGKLAAAYYRADGMTPGVQRLQDLALEQCNRVLSANPRRMIALDFKCEILYFDDDQSTRYRDAVVDFYNHRSVWEPTGRLHGRAVRNYELLFRDAQNVAPPLAYDYEI